MWYVIIIAIVLFVCHIIVCIGIHTCVCVWVYKHDITWLTLFLNNQNPISELGRHNTKLPPLPLLRLLWRPKLLLPNVFTPLLSPMLFHSNSSRQGGDEAIVLYFGGTSGDILEFVASAAAGDYEFGLWGGDEGVVWRKSVGWWWW